VLPYFAKQLVFFGLLLVSIGKSLYLCRQIGIERAKMKLLEVISDKQQRQVWWRAFRIWQHRPHELAPLVEEEHVCASCGISFVGNYCPRCGQSAKIGRFSFKKAVLLFLDVWGLGNRSMFRSIRDLMLRPGYMIRDYIGGMQTAYFPPFKMFFLLAALALVIQHGFGLTFEDEEESVENGPMIEMKEDGETVKMSAQELKDSLRMTINSVEDRTTFHINGRDVETPIFEAGAKFGKMMDMLRKKNPAIFALLTLLLFSTPLFFFFRKAPAIPDLHYPEFFVAMVYTANTYSIYSIAGNLLNSSTLKLIAVLMVFVAMKQFSGFSKRRVLGYALLSGLMSIIFMVVVMAVIIGIFYMTNQK